MNDAVEFQVAQVQPMFSERRLAEFLDYYKRDGKPSTDSIRGLMAAGELPPPDKCIGKRRKLWKYETIMHWVNQG